MSGHDRTQHGLVGDTTAVVIIVIITYQRFDGALLRSSLLLHIYWVIYHSAHSYHHHPSSIIHHHDYIFIYWAVYRCSCTLPAAPGIHQLQGIPMASPVATVKTIDEPHTPVG